MSAAEIDDYLQRLDEPKRSTLSQLRRDILAVVPDAGQCLSYGLPGFKVDGKTIAGFAALKNVNTPPRLNTSLGGPMTPPSACSGEMNPGVPMILLPSTRSSLTSSA